MGIRRTRLAMQLAMLATLAAHAPCFGAAILYDNGVTATTSYIVSDASPSAEQLVADDFVLAPGASSVTGIEWRGTYAKRTTPALDNFTILIHADAAGTPSSNVLYSFGSVSVTRSEPDANFVFSYSADIGLTDLTPGLRYWLSIYEQLPIDYRWSWIFQADGNLWVRASAVEPYAYSIPYKTDFRLTGMAVPEPPSLALLAATFAGLLTLTGVRQRSNHRSKAKDMR